MEDKFNAKAINAKRHEQMPWLFCVYECMFDNQQEESFPEQKCYQGAYNRWHCQ
jgi:hypothetical protein